MDRKKIADKYKWDLKPIFNNVDDFNEEMKDVYSEIDKISFYEDCFMDNAKNFYEAFTMSFDIERRIEKLSVYASLNLDLNTKDNKMQELYGKVSNLGDYYTKKTYFLIPSMFKYSYEDVIKFYDEYEELKNYDIIIKRMFRYKDHTLSEPEEKLLSSLGKTFGNNLQTFELLTDAEMVFDDIRDEDGNVVKIDNSAYYKYIESKDRRVRKDAFMSLYKEYKKFTNTFCSIYSGDVKESVELAKIRKYNSARESALYGDELKVNIYDTLIDVVHEGMDSIYKYYGMKKEILGLDDFHLYDISVPLISDSNDEYSFDKAVDIVLKALNVFGEEYINILKDGIDKRWIDVYPTDAKRTGGYSGGCYDTYPYILLNYQDKYNDMSTLAHEAGHSMHSYYARKNNSYQYGNYSLFVAEVASTVNELLLANYMLKNSKNINEKLSILDRLMKLFRSTIYRQTMFAEFERDVYNLVEKDEVLTSDLLCDMYYKLNKLYFGDNVIIDDEIRYEWERIPHFYYNFYVYKYATGLSAATKIVTGILNNDKNAVSNYLEFLKCGSTKSPLESLKIAGVDLEDKETVRSAIKYFDSIIDEFKKLYNQAKNK